MTINALLVFGLLLVLLGGWLLGGGLMKAALAWFRRRRYLRPERNEAGEEIWSGGVAPRDVYVPGSISRHLRRAVAGLVIAVLGLPPGWIGWSLLAFTPLAEPREVVRIAVDDAMVAVSSPAGGELARGVLAGPLLVAHAEFVRFEGILESLGLGSYIRVTYVASYRSPAAVLNRRGIDRLDVGAPQRLFSVLQRIESWLPQMLETSRRLSPSLDRQQCPAALWASPDILEWR